MRTNTKAVVTGDILGVHWGTGAFWELAVIIYVQHLQICFKSAGTVEKRQVLVCHTKSAAQYSVPSRASALAHWTTVLKITIFALTCQGSSQCLHKPSTECY